MHKDNKAWFALFFSNSSDGRLSSGYRLLLWPAFMVGQVVVRDEAAVNWNCRMRRMQLARRRATDAGGLRFYLRG